ncbi:MAG: hypothetical protein AAF587_33960 [Bacteroidota bacterium]
MRHWLFFFLCLWFGDSLAQTPVDWSLLGEVSFLQDMGRNQGYLNQEPRFSSGIKALEGQLIEISGYMLPLDAKGESYALSHYTYSACFFCGGAGLESVMDVRFAKADQRYQLDQHVRLRGILRLNDSESGLMYLLEEAEEVE